MSTTTTFPPDTPLTWKQADDDVHVATRAGEFAGFVEFDGSAHLVRDERGTDLGSFPTLADARATLENARQGRPPAARAAVATLRRRPHRRPRRARV